MYRSKKVQAKVILPNADCAEPQEERDREVSEALTVASSAYFASVVKALVNSSSRNRAHQFQGSMYSTVLD